MTSVLASGLVNRPLTQESAMDGEGSLTDLIHQARAGDDAALKLVFDAAYNDLRKLARMRLTPRSRGTLLDTTSLVHESYLRFVSTGCMSIHDRRHFICYAGRVMRSVIVDFVRESLAERRGGDALHVTLNTGIGAATVAGEAEIINVHEALEELGKHDARMVQVVEMRYFAGMTEAEIADALGVTDRTVRRDWEKARLLLAESLK